MLLACSVLLAQVAVIVLTAITLILLLLEMVSMTKWMEDNLCWSPGRRRFKHKVELKMKKKNEKKKKKKKKEGTAQIPMKVAKAMKAKKA